MLYVELQRYADAEAQLRVVARRLGVDADAKVALVRGIADPALRGAALQSLYSTSANADIRGDDVLYSAFLTLLGDRVHAIDHLETYAATRNAAAGGMIFTRLFDSLRADPRYAAVLKKMGLPYKPEAASSP